MLVGVVAFLTCCGKSQEDSFTPMLEIELEANIINLFQAGGYDYIPVNSNVYWEVTSTADWLMVDVVRGNGSKTIKIEAIGANTDQEARSAVVTITADGDKLSQTVQVTQLGLTPKILLNVPEFYEISPLGGEFSIVVTASGEWSVGDIEMELDGDEEPWIKYSYKMGRRAYFDLDMNAIPDLERSAVLTFILDGTELKAQVEVFQTFVTEPTINSIPEEALTGRTIRITGVPMNIITEVWFGESKGIINPNTRTLYRIDVTIPRTAQPGNAVPVYIYYGTKMIEKDFKIRLIYSPEVITIRPGGTNANPNPGANFTTDAAERNWKDYIEDGNRFIMQDHTTRGGTRQLHVILLKNETDQPTGPIEFRLDGSPANRYDQNAYFEGNNNTNYIMNGWNGTNVPSPLAIVFRIDRPEPNYIPAGLAPGQEVFLLFRIRSGATYPDQNEGRFVSKFTITGEGIDIEGTIESTTIFP